LTNWVKNNTSDQFFLPTNIQTTAEFPAISNWTIGGGYEQSATNEFMSVADYYLIAQAKQRKAIVVTHEVPSNSLKKIKIPNACIGLKVSFVTPFVMLKQLHAKFVLPSRQSITPPPLPRPPACTCAFTTQILPPNSEQTLLASLVLAIKTPLGVLILLNY
jgi:hypothetical protein